MKLIVGLGNPDKKYALTRHNLGFMLVDKFADLHIKTFDKKKFKSVYAELTLSGEKIILLKPQTFMNNSGEAVREAMTFYKLSGLDIIVCYDDLDQDFGAVRFREKGSSGGHNGIKSIIACLGHENFARVKMGIGKPTKAQTADFVLNPFTAEEQKLLPEILEKGMIHLKRWLDV
jgi:PTH1 family peptidyl-tRNA hydrolase